ncbi:MAG: hypothetical protein QME75_01345 [Deltaproteobacteria bacterium]|nr:hypothetical protein [Deltaproteobacteria bacterium]
MNRFISSVIAGIIIFAVQAPVQAQQEVEPPAIPPMLEDRPPLALPEAKETNSPLKAQQPKAKISAKTAASKKKNPGKANLKKKTTKTVVSKKKTNNTKTNNIMKKKKGATVKPARTNDST